MKPHQLGNVLTKVVPSEGFTISGDVETQGDYNSKVTYTDPSKKPAWDLVVVGKDAEQWKDVRRDRNKKLKLTDWTQLSDSPLTKSKKDKWKVYRQSLRDITTQSDPNNLDWPTQPEA